MKYKTNLERMLTKYDDAIGDAVKAYDFYQARLLLDSKHNFERRKNDEYRN
jgi:hypothetical protein